LCEGARGNTLLAKGKPIPCVREHVVILYFQKGNQFLVSGSTWQYSSSNTLLAEGKLVPCVREHVVILC
jgi:hypothetical protein